MCIRDREQIVPAIEKRLGVKVMFAGDCMGEKLSLIHI